jgi:hypothetical protein
VIVDAGDQYGFPSPSNIARLDPSQLRALGFSGQNVRVVRDLARAIMQPFIKSSQRWHPCAGMVYFHLLFDGLEQRGVVERSSDIPFAASFVTVVSTEMASPIAIRTFAGDAFIATRPK